MRPTNFLGLIGCVFALLTAYFFLEKTLLLKPCPLCILDRIVVGIMALIFTTGLLAKSIRARFNLLGTNLGILLVGFVIAGRHVWLENQPFDEERGCLANSEATKGFIDLISSAFDANADCGIIIWDFLGITIPQLTLVFFVGLLFLLLAQLYAILLDKQEAK